MRRVAAYRTLRLALLGRPLYESHPIPNLIRHCDAVHTAVTKELKYRIALCPTSHLMPKSPPSPAVFSPRHYFERTVAACPGGGSVVDEAILNKLEQRLGRLHAKLRLGIACI
jgi:hypothetical protein